MNAHKANLLNGYIMILMSTWAYFTTSSPSITILIPALCGAVFLICSPGVKTENKIIAHIVVLLTVVIIVALCMPLTRALSRGDTLAIIRIGVMYCSSIIAMVYFIKSFIDARAARNT